jgi:hypothetical protein
MNNLGRAVDELYNEPFKGLLKKDAKETAKGVLKGIKGVFMNSTAGVSNSLSKISGTLYLSLKGI